MVSVKNVKNHVQYATKAFIAPLNNSGNSKECVTWRTYNQRVDVATDAMLAGRLLWLAPHDASRSGNRDTTTTTRKLWKLENPRTTEKNKQQKTNTETIENQTMQSNS